MINREGFYVTDTERECTACGAIFPKKSKTVTLCPSCNSSRVKSQSEKTKMLRRARTRAKEKGVAFDLSLDDFDIPSECPVLGIPLKHHIGRSGGNPESPALDRIDNDKGYVKGNVQVISHLANMMKGAATADQLIKFAEWINKTYTPLSSSDA